MTASTSLNLDANRIQIRNAWYLLLYAWDMAAWRDRWKGATEASPSLLGLLSRILAESTRDLLRHQLGRAYQPRKQIIPGIRGRIDFGPSLKVRAFEEGKAHCTFAELSIDTLQNQILRSTLHHLASDPKLRHSEHPDQENQLRHELRSIVRALDGVSLREVTVADFSRLQLSRNDRIYLLPLSICALVRQLKMPTEEQGDHVVSALLRNEVLFHDLFERFVRNFCRIHARTYKVEREVLRWHDELGSALVPVMKTDMTLIGKQAPHRRLVIDTKYSATTLSATNKFKSENLYQIYAYLRTQEHLSEAHGNASGMLLYPTTSHHLVETMRVQGHRITVATVDLAEPWEQIESNLLALVEPAEPSPPAPQLTPNALNAASAGSA